jgi:hypothetical protein
MKEQYKIKNHIAIFEIEDYGPLNDPVVRVINVVFKEDQKKSKMCNIVTAALMVFIKKIEIENGYNPIYLETNGAGSNSTHLTINIVSEDDKLFEWYGEMLTEYVGAAMDALTDVGPLD